MTRTHTLRERLVDRWRFGPYAAGSMAPGYDDRGLTEVTVPHCVTPLSWRDWAPASWEGLWTYRRELDPPEDFAVPGRRVFVDFDGVLTRATVWINGRQLPEHSGGYLPFSHELTDDLLAEGNVLAVTVDSRWLPIPPSGHGDGAKSVDYFQPGGIYRNVVVRSEPTSYVADVFAKPLDVLDDARRRVEAQCVLDLGEPLSDNARLQVEIRDGSRVVASAEASASAAIDAACGTDDTQGADGADTQKTARTGRVDALLTVHGPQTVRLWDVDDPYRYDVVTRLVAAGQPLHQRIDRIGFRQARFAEDGFFLNGRRHTLFGINRHQLFPYTGMAMPDRVQRNDARLLKDELNITMVRCAHYPQSPAFLDACDELGLLVFEEIPGWQYVGDRIWQEHAVADVEAMVRRDRNRPSIVCWGVQINESARLPELYTRTKQVADTLDGSRATTGAMLAWHYTTEDFVQDLFAYNDYEHTGPPEDSVVTLRPPLAGVPYLVTEAVGSLAGPHFYRRNDPGWIQSRQAYLHACVHEQAYADERHLGLLSWQAFDYDSMTGWVDHHLKCNGIGDTFRILKPGAAVYRAQVDPSRRAVIEPTFCWDFGPDGTADGPGSEAMICSNAERLEIHVDDEHRTSVRPDTERFGHLPAPPSFVDLTLPEELRRQRPQLRIDGYVGDDLIASRHFCADRAQDRLAIWSDDEELAADGADATRLTFAVVDAFSNLRPHAGGVTTLRLEGPADLVGETPFPLGEASGAGAAWLRTRPGQLGTVVVHATDTEAGSAAVRVEVVAPTAYADPHLEPAVHVS